MTSALASTTGQRYRRELQCARELSVSMGFVTLVFLAVVVVFFAAGGVLQAVVGGLHADGGWGSVWEYSQQAMRYYPMSIGVMLVPALMPAYVANGVTRREFTVGAVLMISGIAIGLGVVGAIGFAVEDAIFGWAGHATVYNFPHLFDGPGDVVAVVAVVGEFALHTSSHMVAGWLIGYTYYRYGGWTGTFLLPLTILPALAVEFLLGVSWIGGLLMDHTGYERLALPIVIPAVLATIAAAVLLIYFLTRRLAIKP
ncbi:hypothetical protein [Phytoactinopolyspora mesophila]|uniref:Uncharacterized protein n=1 Tax=Phytoactinopolyspora mesophila TaxID=2650750 RepID=A0A7K3M0Z2_9ACTN|nr:hypothetical protein [Phytoactinopolyspora mesophila]NDL56562.1 hypothetical protein [Phytoactinopolyspora mesophila]